MGTLNTFMIRCTLLSLFFLSLPFSAQGEPEKVFFVGNSYTGGIKGMVSKFFAASPRKDVELTYLTPGGRNLEGHLAEKATLDKIRDGGWDIVVLQDQSQTPAIFPAKFLASSEKLHTIIKEGGAKTVYYETWGRRDGDKKNKHLFPTYEKMQAALSKSYATAAKRDGAILVGVGQAWFDVRAAKPKLGLQLYRGDGSHPSAKGAYLAACCFYAALTGSDPREVEFDGELPAEEAKYFRELGWKSRALAPITK